MKVKDIFKTQKIDKTTGNIIVTGISNDSRYLVDGEMFFIMPGDKFDLFAVIKDLDRRVGLFVAARSLKRLIEMYNLKKPVIFVQDIERALFTAANKFYYIKPGELKIVAITGTNGKTTTAFCLYHLLRCLGEPVSLIGTICYYIGKNKEPATHTTPDFLRLRKLLRRISDSKGKYVIMEVSSHAIVQGRTRGVVFDGCVFTNLSRDHLDYHKDMNSYFKAKEKLFSDNKKALSFINIDDRYGKKIYNERKKKISYGLLKSADFRISEIICDNKGLRFRLQRKGIIYSVNSSLYGAYNVYNIVAALAVIESYGFAMESLVEALKSFRTAEGRLEKIAKNIFVDYAHTPDALKRVLVSLKGMGYEKIICVFGCGGDRDKGKRKPMGRIASQYSYKAVITSDNPRGEDPESICRQIAQGAVKSNFFLIIDRAAAISKGIDIYRSLIPNFRACLLVAGKGHENYQIIAGERFEFKDSKMIREAINGNN